MSMKKVLLILLSLCVITACDSNEEAADGDGGSADGDETAEDAGSGDSDTDTDSDTDSDVEYPSPPYGRQVNNTVEDMRFSSVMCECTDKCDGEPRTRSVECGEPEYWSYSDFHAGEKDILVVMVSAGW